MSDDEGTYDGGYEDGKSDGRNEAEAEAKAVLKSITDVLPSPFAFGRSARRALDAEAWQEAAEKMYDIAMDAL